GGGPLAVGVGDRAGPPPQADPPRLPRSGEPVEEHRAHGAAPAPHELVIGGTVVEGGAGLGHAPAFVAHRAPPSLVSRTSESTRAKIPGPRATGPPLLSVAPGS